MPKKEGKQGVTVPPTAELKSDFVKLLDGQAVIDGIFTVTRFSWGQAFEILPLLQMLIESGKTAGIDLNDLMKLNGGAASKALPFFIQNGELINKILCLSTGEPEEKIKAAPWDVMVAVFLATITVNVDSLKNCLGLMGQTITTLQK